MPAPDLIDLMTLYSRRGIADWRNAQGELRQRARNCLGTAIAENDAEASVTIRTIFNERNANRLRFIPMPKVPTGGIERCFFLPIRETTDKGEEIASFDLFLLVARTDCLAFRFEPAHVPQTTHRYGHVQMSRKMLRKSIEPTGVPKWLPVSYPAFPLATSDPLRMFLSMATAIHGYEGGVTRVLQDIFRGVGRAREVGPYLDELKKLLN